MAVARMLKATVIVSRSRMDDVVHALQGAGVLDIVVLESDLAPAPEPDRRRLREAGELVADAQFVTDFLGRYHKETQPFASFIEEKYHTTTDELRSIEPDAAFRDLYEECERLSATLAHLERERERLERLCESLAIWEDFPLEISRWTGTESAAAWAGTVPAIKADEIRERLTSSVPEIDIDEVGRSGERLAWFVVAHRSSAEIVRSTLALTDLALAAFPPDVADSAASERRQADERLALVAREHAALEDRAHELAEEHHRRVNVLLRALRSRQSAIALPERFAATERTVTVSGWVPEARRTELEAALRPSAEDVDLSLVAASPEDDAPVLLVNRWFIRPFELLTELYGVPRHGEIDPTPYLAFFFFLFFGICIGDVGYGATLIVASYLIKTRLDVAPGVKKFMDLIFAGGLSAIVIGVLTGSWFSIPAESLPPALLALRIADPLQQLIPFLGLTVGLGVLQVFGGVVIAAVDAFRRGEWRDAISQHVSTLIFWAAMAVTAASAARGDGATAVAALVTGIALTVLLKGRVLEGLAAPGPAPALDRALGWGWTASLLGVVGAMAFSGPAWPAWVFFAVTALAMTLSRCARGHLVRTLAGFYEVYGMTGYVSDILSYTRLAALGLSSILVGFVMNILGGMLWGLGGNPVLVVVGIVFGTVVLVVGHAFNIVVNLLGAFVHPARLQFVEFFSKFYEGGGRAYSPFAPHTDRLVVQPSIGQEGGALS